MLNEIDSKELQ